MGSEMSKTTILPEERRVQDISDYCKSNSIGKPHPYPYTDEIEYRSKVRSGANPAQVVRELFGLPTQLFEREFYPNIFGVIGLHNFVEAIRGCYPVTYVLGTGNPTFAYWHDRRGNPFPLETVQLCARCRGIHPLINARPEPTFEHSIKVIDITTCNCGHTKSYLTPERALRIAEGEDQVILRAQFRSPVRVFLEALSTPDTICVIEKTSAEPYTEFYIYIGKTRITYHGGPKESQ